MLMLMNALICHFIGDFLLQSREMGQKKSEDFGVLIQHLLILLAVFSIGMVPILTVSLHIKHPELPDFMVFCVSMLMSVILATGNTVVHGIIDATVWNLYKADVKRRLMKINAKYNGPGQIDPEVLSSFKYWNDKRFYSTIGLDQLLHALTIVFFYYVS